MTIKNEEQPTSSGATYWLSQEQKNELTKKGENNDKDAAFRLAQFYSFVEFDTEKEIYWLEKAAKKGHPIAQYNLAFKLLDQDNPNFDDALRWAEMAKRNSVPNAQDLIDKINNARQQNSNPTKLKR